MAQGLGLGVTARENSDRPGGGVTAGTRRALKARASAGESGRLPFQEKCYKSKSLKRKLYSRATGR